MNRRPNLWQILPAQHHKDFEILANFKRPNKHTKKKASSDFILMVKVPAYGGFGVDTFLLGTWTLTWAPKVRKVLAQGLKNSPIKVIVLRAVGVEVGGKNGNMAPGLPLAPGSHELCYGGAVRENGEEHDRQSLETRLSDRGLSASIALRVPSSQI